MYVFDLSLCRDLSALWPVFPTQDSSFSEHILMRHFPGISSLFDALADTNDTEISDNSADLESKNNLSTKRMADAVMNKSA